MIRFTFLPLFLFFSCTTESVKQDLPHTSPYLNHADSAKYVGIQTCRLCHQTIYDTYIQTGMGRSIGLATTQRSSADFSRAQVHDAFSGMDYKAMWLEDSLYMLEYRTKEAHRLLQRVHFIIGSGQHTNSHLHQSGGYLTQMPMTYYTQKKTWDLPPGFENGLNTRFSRKIGLECMSCHNAYPGFVKGSENKYTSVPQGIDCERCHGPGSIHVAQRSGGNHIDTSRYIDYSIVNPSKLPADLQFDICQRCHLQGNAVLKPNRSFLDFKPGMRLSDVMSVFLPKYKDADDEFIMASHADRLKQSACFIVSEKKTVQANSLKPYKEALTCLTCHNPHLSVKATRSEVFDRACLKCHNTNMPEKHTAVRDFNGKACYSCHMPVSGSTDIPHVTVHDHYIRKPMSTVQVKKIKQFLGLFAINEKNPDELTLTKAYLNQYEKFSQDKSFLDSAATHLLRLPRGEEQFKCLMQLLFFRSDYQRLVESLKQYNEEEVYNVWLMQRSHDNADAWTAYRIAEAYVALAKDREALRWLQKAVVLAPYQPDFRNKLGNAYARLGQMPQAEEQFMAIYREDPRQTTAYVNLGYLSMLRGDLKKAESYFLKGLNLEPDNENLLLNMANYHLQRGKKQEAILTLNRVLQINPSNNSARKGLERINTGR